MTLLQAAILGIVEGLTEFLPVSSTFHLIFVAGLLGLSEDTFVKMFEVVIQAGAISALLFMYTKTLLGNPKLFKQVVISFIPTAIVGAVLYKIIKGVFFTTDSLMLWAFGIVGLIFLGIEYLVARGKIKLTRNLSGLTVKQSLGIGLAQSLAVIPGVSRSGSVIVAMMAAGYERAEAAKYTFLLSMPTIFAASALDLYKNRSVMGTMGGAWEMLAVGFVCAFITAYFVVSWFIKFLASHTLSVFAWYRFAVLVLLLTVLAK